MLSRQTNHLISDIAGIRESYAIILVIIQKLYVFKLTIGKMRALTQIISISKLASSVIESTDAL